MGLTKLKYIDNSNPSKDDYVVTYYNYEHQHYILKIVLNHE